MTRQIGVEWLDELLTPGNLSTTWTDATVHAYLVDSVSTFNPATDKYLSAIPVGDRVASPVVVTGKTTNDGYFDANDITFTVPDGVIVAWFVLVQVAATEATSPIILSTNERADYSPLLLTGNGGLVVFQVQALGLGRI